MGEKPRDRYPKAREVGTVNTEMINSFWDIMNYITEKKLCFQPYCTTCGCMQYRRFLRCIGSERMSNFLNSVTLDELKEQSDLAWHDALEIILLVFGKDIASNTVIFNEYNFVKEKYYELRHTHVPIYKARNEVIRLLKEK